MKLSIAVMDINSKINSFSEKENFSEDEMVNSKWVGLKKMGLKKSLFIFIHLYN